MDRTRSIRDCIIDLMIGSVLARRRSNSVLLMATRIASELTLVQAQRADCRRINATPQKITSFALKARF